MRMLDLLLKSKKSTLKADSDFGEFSSARYAADRENVPAAWNVWFLEREDGLYYVSHRPHDWFAHKDYYLKQGVRDSVFVVLSRKLPDELYSIYMLLGTK